MSCKFIFIVALAFASFVSAARSVYTPGSFDNSKYSSSRSMSTDKWIIYWESGFGSDPTNASETYAVNMTRLKQVLDSCYDFNVQKLKMIDSTTSNAKNYKMIVFLDYTTTWEAYGSGVDNVIGTLTVNPQAANDYLVLAHEIGHTFQYQVGADLGYETHGFRYGLGDNGDGGNGFWEQHAQWVSFKFYPDRQFTDYYFSEYITSNYRNILHGIPRYANYFIFDYWAEKNGGIDFISRIWREAASPQDPVDVYKQITGITQSEFNDQMYEHAAKLTTWDLDLIRARGADYIDSRSQVSMSKVDGYWKVDSGMTVQNYGYNSIKLVAPSSATTVAVNFKGIAGSAGYTTINLAKGGWRLGFVALLSDGTRSYSSTWALNYNGGNPDSTFYFGVPANCSKLWLVVSGAPQEHWHHYWDGTDTEKPANDEQWPYEVKFYNTNLLNNSIENTLTDFPSSSSAASSSSAKSSSGAAQSSSGTASSSSVAVTVTELSYDVSLPVSSVYTPVQVSLGPDAVGNALGIAAAQIPGLLGNGVTYYAVNPDGSLDSSSTAEAPGHWFSAAGAVTTYGGGAATVFAELDLSAMVAKIGNYPDKVTVGSLYTIRQALQYGAKRVQFTYKVTVADSSTTAFRNPVLVKTSIFKGQDLALSAYATEMLNAGARLDIFDMRGTRVATVSGASGISSLRALKNGIYGALLKKDGRILESQNFSRLKGE